MNKYTIALGLCLISAAGFSQSQNPNREIVKDPKTIEMAAKADVSLIDKKTVTTTESAEKRKKTKRVHKECSRMKS